MSDSPRPSSQPPVVLLHSSGMSSRQWGRLKEVLGGEYHVLTPDFLGSGERPPWPDAQPFDLSMDVDLIDRLLSGLGERAHLVGHSYGGLIALALARRSPRLVRSLALYDPVAFGVLHGANDREGLQDLDRLGTQAVFSDEERGGGDEWFEAFVDYWNGKGGWRALPPSTREAFLRVGRKVFREVLALSRERTPAAAYSGLQAPLLLLGGAQSPAAARRVVAILAEAVPGARSMSVEGAGHMGPLTHANVVNEAILRHLAAAG